MQHLGGAGQRADATASVRILRQDQGAVDVEDERLGVAESLYVQAVCGFSCTSPSTYSPSTRSLKNEMRPLIFGISGIGF